MKTIPWVTQKPYQKPPNRVNSASTKIDEPSIGQQPTKTKEPLKNVNGRYI